MKVIWGDSNQNTSSNIRTSHPNNLQIKNMERLLKDLKRKGGTRTAQTKQRETKKQSVPPLNEEWSSPMQLRYSRVNSNLWAQPTLLVRKKRKE